MSGFRWLCVTNEVTRQDMNKSQYPLVSIVIPVYNGSNYLREAIVSALDQSYSNCEVLVVNDGSSDNGETRNIALSFRDRIRYFEKENGGTSTALNYGIQHARGDYISWLSHDDLYFPEKIEKQIFFLNTVNETHAVVYSDYEALDVDNNELSSHPIIHINSCDYLPDILVLLLRSRLHGCTLLIPKSCFTEVAYFDSQYKTTQDYNLWFRLLRHGYKFMHVPEVVVRTRWHKDQGSRTMGEIQCQELEDLNLWVAEHFFHDILVFPSSIVFDIVEFESKYHRKCAQYILDRVRIERPILYCKLGAYKAWCYCNRLIRLYLRPLKPGLVRMGLYSSQDAPKKKQYEAY